MRRYHIYFKTIGMQRWILVKNTNTLLTELTTESIIFLACIDKQRNEEFTKRHLRVARTIADINVGDSLKYTDAETGQIRCAILLGRTKEGKYMIHFEH